MSWQHKENAIREQRTIEATKKNLMGSSGKLGTIAKYMGKIISRHYDHSFSDQLIDDDFDAVYCEYEKTISGQQGPLMWKDEIPEMEGGASDIGYLFDGLSSGIHLEIQLFNDANKITVYYKGKQVYQECAGELESYAPSSDWEKIIDNLYSIAKKRMKSQKAQFQTLLVKEVAAKKSNFLERLRMRWGI